MSLVAFQEAISLLLRCPNPEREPKIWQKIDRYLLSAEERQSLLNLAEDSEFNKYGREQRDQRWKMTFEKLQYINALIPEENLYDLWLHDFEPNHVTLRSDMSSSAATYSLAFLRFLASDDKTVTAVTAEAPAYIFDLVKLLSFQIELAQHVVKSPTLAKDAVIKSRDFRLMVANYDLLSWIEAYEESDSTDPLPVAEMRLTYILLNRSQAGETPRVFEVEAQTYAFLMAQLNNGTTHQLTPELRQDLQCMNLL